MVVDGERQEFNSLVENMIDLDLLGVASSSTYVSTYGTEQKEMPIVLIVRPPMKLY